MYGKELALSGIYGIKDLTIDRIVYVGSTQNAFGLRWGKHIYDAQQNKHCNERISDLILSNNFEFVILDSNYYNNADLLNKEREYSFLYDVYNSGYSINVGGSNISINNATTNNLYKTNLLTIKAQEYINKWLNKRINVTDRAKIISIVSQYINIDTRCFTSVVKKLGFKVCRLKTKSDWIIHV